ncbi:Oidioi.mRNA.OKI2018_I69.chr2.g7020.t1.cds [Oikopleura dioica]|uniref:Oidioi.mRNA.OKI2018_I69.chr2.g7020.t1.cds n=1 Tax=Oikopleura dioica TaxID=34765 RepID=A0ABN7TBL4_OIKDI|nr:Oidioi.mRNA.OKI2018_I69.chr2.g7020.t1.cds [Oikopleura dioica]
MKRLWDRNRTKDDYEQVWSENENPAYLSDDSSETTYDAEYQDVFQNDYDFTDDSSSDDSDSEGSFQGVPLREADAQNDLRIKTSPNAEIDPESLLSERAFEKKTTKKVCKSCKSKNPPVPRLKLDTETPRQPTVDVIFDAQENLP